MINVEEKKQQTPIKMALGVKNDLVLFLQQNATGLYLGVKSEYKTRGVYTGELLKLCGNEESYIFYTLYSFLRQADNPAEQNKLGLIYYILQKQLDQNEIEAIKQIIKIGDFKKNEC